MDSPLWSSPKFDFYKGHIEKKLGGSVQNLEHSIVPLPKWLFSKKFRGLWDEIWSSPKFHFYKGYVAKKMGASVFEHSSLIPLLQR